ncbi:MAG: helix-turn-helix domain-containing protein [Anaerorhabdus sp.]|uniref:helix-turn-helix domain-containing protein n=1 Tax=Anaerorhabdus sp. TaxID=1872524 RepID=UPI003A83B59F
MRDISRRTAVAGLVSLPVVASTSAAMSLPVVRLSDEGVILRSIEVVANYFGVSAVQLAEPVWRRKIVTPRAKAIYLAYELTGKRVVEVGAYFGKDCEASAWYPLLRAYELGAADRTVAAELRGLAQLIDPVRASRVDWDARPRIRR